MKTNPGFDFLAPVYDSLARLIFGEAMVDSQTCFLDRIPIGAKILILGGGTGWLLEKINEQNKSCKILYVDVSAEMIKKAKGRMTKDEIHFVQGTEQDIPKEMMFDVIITNFYFDLFSDEKLKPILERIHQHTKRSSSWYVTDFVEATWWHRWMLKLMYFFFRVVCKIDGAQLPKWRSALQSLDWNEKESKSHFKGFINSSIWAC